MSVGSPPIGWGVPPTTSGVGVAVAVGGAVAVAGAVAVGFGVAVAFGRAVGVGLGVGVGVGRFCFPTINAPHGPGLVTAPTVRGANRP